MKKCIAIRTGRMNDGKIFCDIGKTYLYRITNINDQGTGYCYVDSDQSYRHWMSKKFFDYYFTEEFLGEEEMIL